MGVTTFTVFLKTMAALAFAAEEVVSIGVGVVVRPAVAYVKATILKKYEGAYDEAEVRRSVLSSCAQVGSVLSSLLCQVFFYRFEGFAC